MADVRRTPEERAVIDRLHRLRVVLPAMASETAVARRAAARLRRENARLATRVAALEAASAHLRRHAGARIDEE
jgi:BMFP domain-containing protein YqiC